MLPAFTTLADEARIAADNVLGMIMRGGTPTVRLGVTGLSRAGKTVFITALIHNLVHGGRLPLFDAYASGRLADARLMPQPDDEVPRFDYEAHVRDLVERRVWPDSTRRIAELRVVIEYESAELLKRTLGRGRLNLDIVDYPGEWLLDLALLAEELRRMVGGGGGDGARAAPRRRGGANGSRRSTESTRASTRTRTRRGGSPKCSPTIFAPRAPTSTRSPCCRPAASSCRATWKARPPSPSRRSTWRRTTRRKPRHARAP